MAIRKLLCVFATYPKGAVEASNSVSPSRSWDIPGLGGGTDDPLAARVERRNDDLEAVSLCRSYASRTLRLTWSQCAKMLYRRHITLFNSRKIMPTPSSISPRPVLPPDNFRTGVSMSVRHQTLADGTMYSA